MTSGAHCAHADPQRTPVEDRAGDQCLIACRTRRSGCSPRCSTVSPIEEQNTQGLDRRASRSVFSKKRLRQSVLRDLAWLVQCPLQLEIGDDDPSTGCRRSALPVLNFGLPALSGRVASSLDIAKEPLQRGDPPRRNRHLHQPRILAVLARHHDADRRQASSNHHNVADRRRDPRAVRRGRSRCQSIFWFELENRAFETGNVQITQSPLNDAGGLMDPRLLQYYNLELQHLRR